MTGRDAHLAALVIPQVYEVACLHLHEVDTQCCILPQPFWHARRSLGGMLSSQMGNTCEQSARTPPPFQGTHMDWQIAAAHVSTHSLSHGRQ